MPTPPVETPWRRYLVRAILMAGIVAGFVALPPRLGSQRTKLPWDKALKFLEEAEAHLESYDAEHP